MSAFIGRSVEGIIALKPDLAAGFSGIQADLTRKLIAANLAVLGFNQRSVQGILDVFADPGALVNQRDRARDLSGRDIDVAERTQQRAACRSHRPRTYFEEWDEPLICAIPWVRELIEIAGGVDTFAARAPGAAGRKLAVAAVVQQTPEVTLPSCAASPSTTRRFWLGQAWI